MRNITESGNEEGPDHGLPVKGSHRPAPRTPNLGVPEEDLDYFPAGLSVVKADDHGKFGTRTGRNE